jgi:Fic family protein/predicted transcriptional regulator
MRKRIILDWVIENPGCSSKEIFEGINSGVAYSTIKRILSQLIADQFIATDGQGKARKYFITPFHEVLYPVDVDRYFEKEIDERRIKKSFNFSLIRDVLSKVELFNQGENQKLIQLQKQFLSNISKLSASEYAREMERLAIDLSWKSSQIEGNTYTLLETERLLKEKETAAGKKKDEAVMLLNHKEAIDFILAHKDYLSPLTIQKMEDIHGILIKDLGVDRNVRLGRVGISGTNYKPLDNGYQIMEAFGDMCDLINPRDSIFEKALLILVLISYIQPFVDGNKRTARIVSNAILIENGYCPISFRTVDSVDYKKALLVFYEQNNISAFKDIFISQFEFAVKTYF